MYRMAGKEEFSSEMRASALEKGGGRGENEKEHGDSEENEENEAFIIQVSNTNLLKGSVTIRATADTTSLKRLLKSCGLD